MPRSVAASASMAALRAPVDTISFRRGSRSRVERGSGVRSRIAQSTSKPFSRSTTASTSARWSLKTVTVARPSSTDQSARRNAAFW